MFCIHPSTIEYFFGVIVVSASLKVCVRIVFFPLFIFSKAIDNDLAKVIFELFCVEECLTIDVGNYVFLDLFSYVCVVDKTFFS